MLGLIGAVAAPLLNGLFGLIDQAVEDKDEAGRIKARLREMALDGRMKEIEAAAATVAAEVRGESWLQRNWRPGLMALFGLIVANNYVLVPLFGTPSAEIPPDMWDLLKLGVGGYIVGRSVEKGARAWKS